MKKIILFSMLISIGLSAEAFSWQNLLFQPSSTIIPGQPSTFSTIQPYNQMYNNQYYQNPYQTQCQVPYVNPYLYQRRQSYINPYNVINPIVPNQTTTGGASQAVKNIGQSLIYSMMQGY